MEKYKVRLKEHPNCALVILKKDKNSHIKELSPDKIIIPK